MAKNPGYVRLADHMVHGLCVDIDSGFALSGYDVQPFPENKDQQKYVRKQINAGIIEPASAAEYETAHPEEDEDEATSDARAFVDAVKAVGGGSGKQEHRLREKESGRTEAIRAARRKATADTAGDGEDDDDDGSFEADQARRERVAAEQEENEVEAKKAAKAEKAAKKK